MSRTLEFVWEYPFSQESVWRVITEPDLIREWLMENDFCAVVGAKGMFTMPKAPGFDGKIAYEVLEVDRPNRLVYTWDGGSWGKSTLEWILSPTPSGTLLTLRHVGFDGFKPFLLSFMFKSGWKTILSKRIPEFLTSEENKVHEK